MRNHKFNGISFDSVRMSRSESADRFSFRERVVDPFDDRAVSPVDDRASASGVVA